MSPCMCGDAECPSCGLAQGTLTRPFERLSKTAKKRAVAGCKRRNGLVR